MRAGSHPYCRNTPRSGQMPSPGRFEDVQGQLRGLGKDREGRGSSRYLHWMESHVLWVFCRFLREYGDMAYTDNARPKARSNTVVMNSLRSSTPI